MISLYMVVVEANMHIHAYIDPAVVGNSDKQAAGAVAGAPS